MKSWGLSKTSLLIYIIIHFSLAINAAQSINFSAVKPQVSFQSVTELAVTQPDQTIAYGKDPLQFGHLWKPVDQPNKPLIIFIHGGCWLNAFGVDHSFAFATALSQAGYPVWSLEYRRTGDTGGGWPGSFHDIKSALSQLDLLQPHINTEEIILMGHSAGGHLALLAASELTAIKFKQVIGLAAITDISRYALGNNSCQSAASQFMNGLPHEASQAYHQANLVYRQIPKSVLLLQGDADRIVPVIQSRLHEVKVEMMKDAGHFDWIHPGSPAFKKLLHLLDP